jgi:hypothetical protein
LSSKVSALKKDSQDDLGHHTASFQTYANTLEFQYASMEEAFPVVEPGRKPVGDNILVQIRQPKSVSKGGIILTDQDRSTEYYNTRVAKVIDFGPGCFVTKKVVVTEDGPECVNLPWPEGKWFNTGDFVEIPQYGGQRFTMNHQVQHKLGQEKITVKEEVTFCFFKAKDIIALITVDPRSIKSYADS